jgi:hypothetical protein
MLSRLSTASFTGELFDYSVDARLKLAIPNNPDLPACLP